MKKICAFFMLFATLFILCGAEPLWKNLSDGGKGKKIFYLPQFTEFKEISEQDMLFFKKTLSRAEKENALALIIELDTPGGNVETALKYISLFARKTVPIVVYLNPHGISAGMIIALGADRIAINPLGVIGDAMPIQQLGGKIRPIADKPKQTPPVPQAEKDKKLPDSAQKKSAETDKALLEQFIKELKEYNNKNQSAEEQALADQKFLTVFYKIMEMLALKNNRPAKIVRAACDPYIELDKNKDGIEHKSGSPLTLSASEAHRLGIVDFIAKDRHELAAALGAPDAEIVEITKNAWEQIVSLLAHPILSGILLTLGLIGIFIEIRTPGFGVSGTLGLLFIVMFFMGHIASGASEWGPMVVFFIGLILILLEIFLIPGFGIVGILGGGCVFYALLSAFGSGNLTNGLRVIVFSLLAVIVICILLYTYVLPKSKFFGRFTLNETSGNIAHMNTAAVAFSPAVGMQGISISQLKPTGKVQFNEHIIDGRSFDGSVIPPDTTVVIVKLNSFDVEVKPVHNA